MDMINQSQKPFFNTDKERTEYAKGLLKMLFENELIPEFDGYQEWILIRQLPISKEEKNKCSEVQDLARRIMISKGYARQHPQFNMESVLTDTVRELYKLKIFID